MNNSDFQTPDWACQLMVSMLPDWIETVLEPTPGKGNIVRALTGYRVTAPKNFWKILGRFDAIVMNPPFTPMETGYKILSAVMNMSDVIIALMPWLTIINSKNRTRDIMNFGLKSITHLPRETFAGSRVQTCILEMQKDYLGETKFIVARHD